MSTFFVDDRASFVTVILYLPGYSPTWMYSPFLLVFVIRGLLPLSRFWISTVAPSTRTPAADTLPLICPLCANAGAAASPKARVHIATVRRMMMPVMDPPKAGVETRQQY